MYKASTKNRWVNAEMIKIENRRVTTSNRYKQAAGFKNTADAMTAHSKQVFKRSATGQIKRIR